MKKTGVYSRIRELRHNPYSRRAMMRKYMLFLLFGLVTLLLTISTDATIAQVPWPESPQPEPGTTVQSPPPESQDSQAVFSAEYMNASQALQESYLQDDETQRRQLLREAVKLYTADLQKRPAAISACNNRGVAYVRLGEYESAIEDYNAALALGGTSADLLKNRGLAYERMGDLDSALADFRAFLDRIADAPSERREDERVFFSDKVAELSQEIEGNKTQEGTD